MNYLPNIHQDCQQQFSALTKAYDELATKYDQWGPLDEKTRRLIKLVAIGQTSEGAVRSHARRALEKSISVEELRHAAILAFTTAGFPAMGAALK